MNPIATMYMKNGKKIVIELLPEAAPNTVNSFIYAAQKKIFDNHNIQRIVPQDWIDASYTGFNKKEGQYLTPYESWIHPEIEPLPSDFGCICMGGYGDMGQSGCEFFFPLRPCPEHKGRYPVFGKVLEGQEELLRIRDVEIVPVTTFPNPNVKVNRPVHPEIIERVEVELNGYQAEMPVVQKMEKLPPPWQQYWDWIKEGRIPEK